MTPRPGKNPSVNRTVEQQARFHRLKNVEQFGSAEELVMALMFRKAHEYAAAIIQGPVLDVGCNTGFGTSLLRELSGLSVTGLDVSARAIDQARNNYGGDFMTVDGQTLPAKDSNVGSVTCFQVIEHVADPEAFVAEVRRVLRPGGTAVFTTPNAAIRLDPGQRPWYRLHVNEFRPDELRLLFANWFDGVEILGLFGTPAIEEIERSRISRLRKIGRIRQPIAPILPIGWEDRLVRVTKAALAIIPKRPSSGRVPAFTTSDLEYRDICVENALDLLAVCKA